MQEPPEFDISDPDVQRGAERIVQVVPCMLGIALAFTLARPWVPSEPRPMGPFSAAGPAFASPWPC